MVCDKDLAEEEREDEEELEGYRIKNKNPTQRCGELCPIKKTQHILKVASPLETVNREVQDRIERWIVMVMFGLVSSVEYYK